MKTIEMSDATLSVAEYAKGVARDPVVFTVGGSPVAALISTENADLETLSLSTSPEFMAMIERSREQSRSGKTVPASEVRRMLQGDDAESGVRPPSSLEYTRALERMEATLSSKQRAMLIAHYRASDRTITARQLAKKMGWKDWVAAKLHYGKLAGRLGDELEFHPHPEFKVGVVATFSPGKPSAETQLAMRPELAQALEDLGWV